MTFVRCALVAVVISFGTMTACSYSQPPPAEAVESTEVTPPPESAAESPSSEASLPADDAPASPTGACDDRKCSVDQDCCEGYGCSLDPARSRVQRYCLSS